MYKNLIKELSNDLNMTEDEVRTLKDILEDDVIEDDFDEYWDEDWEDDDYVPSATNGDYSPTCPWNAPGMSIHDFI